MKRCEPDALGAASRPVALTALAPSDLWPRRSLLVEQMKTPIEVSEIRKGDLIRLERVRISRPAAFEYRAIADRDESGWFESGDTYFLLDRPTPPVELPTEPTLGVLTWISGPNTQTPGQSVSLFAEWYPSVCISTWQRSTTPTQMHASGIGLQIPFTAITAFTPATAVPTAALDELRSTKTAMTVSGLWESIHDFLAAIDGAQQ